MIFGAIEYALGIVFRALIVLVVTYLGIKIANVGFEDDEDEVEYYEDI